MSTGGRGSEVRSKYCGKTDLTGRYMGKNMCAQVSTVEDRVRTDKYGGRTDVYMSRVV